jgi:hypothetical protein
VPKAKRKPPHKRILRNQYDEILKDLLRDPGSILHAMLTGGVAVAEELDVELRLYQTRRADLLWKTVTGRIVHIEVQNENFDRMPLRMIEYLVPIVNAHGPDVSQIVVYTGHAPLTMPSRMVVGDNVFEHRQIDFHRLRAEDLLKSGSMADTLLSLLTGDAKSAVKDILRRIAKFPTERRIRALTLLNQLTGLRPNLTDTVDEEIVAMPIESNDYPPGFFSEERLQRNPLFRLFTKVAREQAEERVAKRIERQLKAQVKAQVEAKVKDQVEARVQERLKQVELETAASLRASRDLLLSQLLLRFGRLPQTAKRRVNAATEAELRKMSTRVVLADSMDAVFTDELDQQIAKRTSRLTH